MLEDIGWWFGFAVISALTVGLISLVTWGFIQRRKGAYHDDDRYHGNS